MTSVYTSVPLSSKIIQSPDYVARNISGETAARPGELTIIGFPHAKQVAYDNYLINLNGFLYATSVQAKVACDVLYYLPKIDPVLLVPLPLPSLVVSPVEPLRSEEVRTEFMRLLGRESKIIKFINTQYFLLENISVQEVQALPKGLDPNPPSPSNATSLFGMKQYLTAMKIISLFLATHTYPAFQTDEDADSRYERDIVVHFEKKVAPDDLLRVSEETRAQYLEDEQVIPKCAFLADDDTWNKSKFISRVEESVLSAKPAPLRPSINYGPPNSVPALPGYVLPYFRGVLQPSLQDITNIMRMLFIKSMGRTKEEAEAGWKDFVLGAERWYKTDSGMVLTHILHAVRAALEAQARLFLIISNGQYLGCTILGCQFNIIKNNISVDRAEIEEVATACRDLDEHSKSLQEVCEILSKLEMRDGLEEVAPVEPRRIKTSRRLLEEIQSRKRPGEEDMDDLKKAMEGINFGERYYTFALDKIVRMVEKLSLREKLDVDEPMYIPPESIYDETIEFNVLSAFGPVAPTFWDSRGKEYEIPRGATAPDPLSVMDETGRRPLNVILISGKKLSVAAQEMVGVVKKRVIRQNEQERAAGYRTLKFAGHGRDAIWDALKLLPYKPAPKEKRRPEAEEEDAAGPSRKKAKKTVVGAATFDVSSF